MDKLKIVADSARKALTVRRRASQCDTFLLARAKRLIRMVKLICEIPEVTETNLAIDRFSLLTATWFSDAGLAELARRDNRDLDFATDQSAAEKASALCEEVLKSNLSSVLSPAQLEKVGSIITESFGRFTDRPEAMILSDARNLDDMGLIGFLGEFNRHILQGKGLETTLKLWKRKIDYKYWQARIREDFRFETVRRIAQRRLSLAIKCIEHIRVEAEVADFSEFLANESLSRDQT